MSCLNVILTESWPSVEEGYVIVREIIGVVWLKCEIRVVCLLGRAVKARLREMAPKLCNRNLCCHTHNTVDLSEEEVCWPELGDEF